MADSPNSAASQPLTAAQAASEFWRWWKQHLYECVPAAIRERIATSRRPAMWSPSDDRCWPAAAALSEHKPFSHSALAQRGGDVALVVGDANGFRRTVELPLAVEARLDQVLAFEIDRLTPLRAADLFYDFHVVERNAEAGTCRVELVAVPRARVTPMLDNAKQRTVNVTRMLLDANDVDTRLDLLRTARSADETTDRYAWVNPALAVLCLLLALALVAFPLWQMRQQVIDLMPVEAKARADAEVASVLQRQLEKQVTEYNLPLSRKHSSPLAIQVLDDLSKRLPEDTWAQSLEIRSVPNQKTREVVIQGETGSGGKLLQIVQESPLIKDPAFKATMTRVAPNAERFHIAGELVLAEMPKQIQLSDAAAVTTVQVSPNAPAGAPSTARSGNAVTPAAVAGTSATPPTPAVSAAAPASQPPPGGVTAAGAALAGEGRKAASTVSPAPSNTTPMLVSPASPPEKKP